MSLPEINFHLIRPHNGNRYAGFEELVAQLASLDAYSKGHSFVRKGQGGDAGVECFSADINGNERGWQAKYLFSWEESLKTQLDSSISAALKKHPKLTEYIVCLPFDLPDNRTNNQKSARSKWEAWKSHWESKAKGDGRNLECTLWGSNTFTTLLSNEEPIYVGKLIYWFDQTAFSQDWFKSQFENAKASLGSRYTPEHNVELQLSKSFLSFVRDPSLQEMLDKWNLALLANQDVPESIQKATLDDAEVSHAKNVKGSLADLISKFQGVQLFPEHKLPLGEWEVSLVTCVRECRNALKWTYDLPTKNQDNFKIEKKQYTQYQIRKLIELIDEIRDELSSNNWRLANEKALLLEGPAGVGKSHFLADIVNYQVERGRPAIFIPAGVFSDATPPWQQVIQEVGLPSTTRLLDFLGALNAAGETAGIRLMICIDALNERLGINIWPNRLAAFINEVNKFPYICIGLSCRSTFSSYIIPKELYDKMPHLTHPGFGEDGGAAAKYYLQARGIARVGAPNTVNEFNNPLFLKTCCDSLEREGKSELPKGLQGVTTVFDFYHTAITNALTRRMKLDPFQQIPKRALEHFSKLLLASGNNYATVPDALAVFEDIYPSNGDSDRSLLSQLEHEGVLTTEYVRQADGSDCQMVRFTFERLSDYNLAERLIAEHLDTSCPLNAFVRGEKLHELLFGYENYRFSGIIEALAVLLPEKFDLEILDLGEVNYNVVQAFKESLLWRNHEYFSDRTFELLNQYLPEESLHIILSIVTEPRNKFNADFLHEQLWPLSMPARDEKWSIPIVSDYFAPTAIDTLITWASENGFFEIDENRARLAATALAWLLCVTNRQIRDRATKALATIIAPRLYLAAEIVAKFANVNDQYIVERVLAAAYGGALQCLTTDGLNTLAQSVFDATFGKSPSPINALIRDNAYGLLKFAELKGFLPAKIANASIDPPYKSQWPLEFVPDDEIEKFEIDAETGKRTYDQIVGSTINDGDFARYVIDSRLDAWSPALIGSTKFPKCKEVFESWRMDFKTYASEEQSVAFGELFETIKKINDEDKNRYREPPELTQANAKFKKTLSSDNWEDYRVRAKNYLEFAFFENREYDSEARFDTRWCRRWICKMAHELGWEHDRFYEFDRSTASARNDHKLERIGKKYQWIAFHELAGRMSDNLAYLGGYKHFDYGEFRGLADARELGLREIDPSLLVVRTHHEGWKQPENCWWTPFNPYLKERSPLERLQWLEDDSSIVQGEAVIELNETKSGRKWLALDAFGNWRQRGVFNNRETIQQDIWYRLRCVVVKKQDLVKFLFDIKDKSLTNPDTFRQFELPSEIFLGEYPWHPSLANIEDWRVPELNSKLTVPHRATTAEYICERGGYDYSIDKTVALNLPAPWLADILGLRLSNGKELNYLNSRGEVIFKDPSVLSEGPNAAVIDKVAFLDILENEGLCPVWIFAGEKNIYGGSDAGSGFGGCRIYSSVYCIEGKERKIVKKAEFKDRLDPYEDQLLKFFEGDEVPAGINKRGK